MFGNYVLNIDPATPKPKPTVKRRGKKGGKNTQAKLNLKINLPSWHIAITERTLKNLIQRSSEKIPNDV